METSVSPSRMPLRAASEPGSAEAALKAAAAGGVREAEQPKRALDSLVADGLIVEFEGGYRLP